MSADENKALVRRVFDAINQGNLDVLIRSLHRTSERKATTRVAATARSSCGSNCGPRHPIPASAWRK